jgi:CRP/FNR family transcriptional regulator, cyclic AMP receptor protein
MSKLFEIRGRNGSSIGGGAELQQTPDDGFVKEVLLGSMLIHELRDYEIDTLARIMAVREYKAGDAIVKQGDANYNADLRDKLLMLGRGEVEVTYSSRGATATLNVLRPGDLAFIIGFVSGDMSQISASVTARTDCRLLALDRVLFESLLNSQPAVVYYVMRSIASYVHGIVRRLNMESAEMSNYLYCNQGRY